MAIRIFIIALFILASPVYSFNSCNILPIEEEKLLSMSYDHFDQSENGWRTYAKLGCYHEIGVIIDEYLEQHKMTLADWQVISVAWHAGQMYAFNNEYQIAIRRFDHSLNSHEPKDSPILWNDYVYATIAFLDKDFPKLKLYRDKIARGPIFDGKKINLDIIDNLIRNFWQPYSVAYQISNPPPT